MASRKADWVRGASRLSSSTSTTLAKTGPGTNRKERSSLSQTPRAGDVGGQQVGRALHAVEGPAEAARERPGERGLPAAGDVLDEHVPAGEQRAGDQLHRRVAAADDAPDVVDHAAREAGRGAGHPVAGVALGRRSGRAPAGQAPSDSREAGGLAVKTGPFDA